MSMPPIIATLITADYLNRTAEGKWNIMGAHNASQSMSDDIVIVTKMYIRLKFEHLGLHEFKITFTDRTLAPNIPPQLELLAREGRLCFVALMQGTRVEADFGLIQRKHLTVTGSTLRSRTVEQKAAIIAALKERVWPLWAAGKLRVFTYQQFPLVEAAEAHRLMESSRHIGKILLVP